MRFFFWFVVLVNLLTVARPGLAQDSLLYNTTTPLILNPSTVIDASTALKWRLSGSLGFHRQLQNLPSEKLLYLTNGFHALVAADYFVGSNWGLGVQIGYQNLRVSDAYKRDPAIPANSAFSPLTSLHSFMLTAGPVLSFPLGQRVTLDFDLRGGIFYNDAPVLKAYAIGTEGPVLTVTPSDQRFRLGANGSVGLKYQLTQQLSLGLSGNVSHSSFDYTQVISSRYTQNQVNLNMFGVQATIAYRFLSKPKQAPVVAPTIAPKPICYPPILDTSQPSEYEIGTERPVIRWRSSAPVYTEGERYVFRLYTLPGNKFLYERTVQEPQFSWPAQLALPDTASYYFYSIYTTRSDEAEQSCRSEPIVGTFGFLSRQTPAPFQRVAPREPTAAFTLRLYELQPSLVYQKVVVSPVRSNPVKRQVIGPRSAKNRLTKPSTQQTASRSSTVVRADSNVTRKSVADSSQIRLAVRDSVTTDSARTRLPSTGTMAGDSMVLSLTVVPALIREEPIQQPTFIWPGSVVLPVQPTVYQYTITRNSDRVLLQSYYLMVEPDGCSQIINEALKNKYLRNSLPPNKPTPDATQPTNKGQP